MPQIVSYDIVSKRVTLQSTQGNEKRPIRKNIFAKRSDKKGKIVHDNDINDMTTDHLSNQQPFETGVYSN